MHKHHSSSIPSKSNGNSKVPTTSKIRNVKTFFRKPSTYLKNCWWKYKSQQNAKTLVWLWKWKFESRMDPRRKVINIMKVGSKVTLAYSQPLNIRTLFSLQFVLINLLLITDPLMIFGVTTAQAVMKNSRTNLTIRNNLTISWKTR